MNRYTTSVHEQEQEELHNADLSELIDVEFLKLVGKKEGYIHSLHGDSSVFIYRSPSNGSCEVVKTVGNQEYSYGETDRRDTLLRILCLVSPAFAQDAEIVAIREKFMP